MSEQTTPEEREWLSRNWTPSDTTFRPWVAGSTKAHRLVPRLIADVDQAEAQSKTRGTELGEARELLGRMHGQYHAILGLTPPPKECVNACKPVATFLTRLEKGDGDE